LLDADFFGFFGALKKGDFFWVDAKKVGQGQSGFAERLKASVAAHASNSLFPRPLREVIEGEPTSGSSAARRSAGAKAETFLGSTPKNSFLPFSWQRDLRDPH